MNPVLLIGGSDPSCGAGIQADLITLKDFQAPAVCVITALTAQNEKRVLNIYPTPSDILTQQLSAVCENQTMGAVKIGMLATLSNVKTIVWFLKQKQIPHIVVDPIFHSSTGTPLLEPQAISIFRRELFPLTTVVTPNILEAQSLVGFSIYDTTTQEKAARTIFDEIVRFRNRSDLKKTLAVIVKGGHLKGEAVDLLFDGSHVEIFRAARIFGSSPRGTGCRFGSAIAASLVQGFELKKAVEAAKKYLTDYIRSRVSSNLLR